MQIQTDCMKRFLSELWSSEAPQAPQPAAGAIRPAKFRLRTLASRLVSPSSSDDEQAAKHSSAPERSTSTCVGSPRTDGGRSSTQPGVQTPANSALAITRPSAKSGADQEIRQPLHQQKRRCARTACKSRASPSTSASQYSYKLVRSAAGIGVLQACDCLAPGLDSCQCCQLPALYKFGSTCCVGQRLYWIPESSYLDSCPLAWFQISELRTIPGVVVKMLHSPGCCTFSFASIWKHCVSQVELLVQDFGGPVCIFKIGISSNVGYRMQKYKESNFAEMRLIHCSENNRIVEILEILLVATFRGRQGCRNVAPGGEGSMALGDPYGPYFLYSVGARADGKLAIGW